MNNQLFKRLICHWGQAKNPKLWPVLGFIIVNWSALKLELLFTILKDSMDNAINQKKKKEKKKQSD